MESEIPTPQELGDFTAELAELLSDRAQFWSEEVRSAAEEVHRGRIEGARHFLGLCGGAGSLTDFTLALTEAGEEEESKADIESPRHLYTVTHDHASEAIRATAGIEYEGRHPA